MYYVQWSQKAIDQEAKERVENKDMKLKTISYKPVK